MTKVVGTSLDYANSPKKKKLHTVDAMYVRNLMEETVLYSVFWVIMQRKVVLN